MSLNQARDTYKKIGSISEEFVKWTRLPLDGEREQNQKN